MSSSSASIYARKSDVSSRSSRSCSSGSGGACYHVLSIRLRAAAILRDGNGGGSSCRGGSGWRFARDGAGGWRFARAGSGVSKIGTSGGCKGYACYRVGSTNAGGYCVSSGYRIGAGAFN